MYINNHDLVNQAKITNKEYLMQNYQNTNECLDLQFQIKPTQAYTQTIYVQNNRYK